MREEVTTPVPSVALRDLLGVLHGFPSLQMQKGCGPKKSHCNWMNVHSHTLDCADSHTHIFIVRSHCDIDIVITVVSRNTEGWGLIIHFWKQTKQISHDPFFNSRGKAPVVYVLKARNTVYSLLWRFTRLLKSSGTSLRLSDFILAKKKKNTQKFFSLSSISSKFILIKKYHWHEDGEWAQLWNANVGTWPLFRRTVVQDVVGCISEVGARQVHSTMQIQLEALDLFPVKMCSLYYACSGILSRFSPW